MHKFLPTAYFQGQFIPFEAAKLSIATHALHYGTGAFGGLRAFPDPQNPKEVLLFRLDRHCQRLSESIVRHGQLITPGFDQDILEGITRDSVLTIARDLGIPVLERPVDKSELLIADEAFLTGTAAKITPIQQIENYRLPLQRPITQVLRDKLVATTENRDSQYRHWVYTVAIA